MKMNITYVSPCADNSGYAEAARNHIAALHSVGVKVNVVPISFEGYRSDLGKLGALVQGMIGRNRPGKIKIIHATPQNYPKFKDPNMYNIGYCAWETNLLPIGWNKLINNMDEVWVPSNYNAQVMKDSGVERPVFVMPHPFNTEYMTATDNNVVSNINDDDFVFYSIFQWIERKNPVDLLRAYLSEFKKEEKVVLIIKTYIVNPNNISESERIKEKIRDIKAHMYLREYPKVLLISSLLSKSQIAALHNRGDCYVSLHRSEGFGIPLAEAMLASNPVIATKYGGSSDFISSQMLVDYQLTPVHGMPWNIYTAKMNWANPDILQARKHMRWAFKNKKKIKEIGKIGQKVILNDLSWNKIGNQMKARLDKILGEI